MKTPIIIALSIVCVLGTAGTAMAVNAGTLASFNRTAIGNAPTVLDPTLNPASTATPRADDPSTAAPEPSEPAAPTTGTYAAPSTAPEPSESEHEYVEPKYTSTPTPTKTYSGDDHSGSSTGSGSDD